MSLLSIILVICVLCIKIDAKIEPYNIEEFVTSRGYSFESHSVTTSDGYIIPIHRIPSSLSSSKVVLLVPCLSCPSMVFVVMGPGKSLGFILADEGYDVWMMNYRGSLHSSPGHLNLSSSSKEFWDFSQHEMGNYDMPSTIDYILNETGVEKIDVSAMSLGGAVTLIMLDKHPQYNDKIRGIAMGFPAAYIKHAFSVATLIGAPLNRIIMGFIKAVGISYYPVEPYASMQQALTFCTKDNPINRLVCSLFLFLASCDTLIDMDEFALQNAVDIFPDSLSMKTVEHFAQCMNHGFRKFDYGILGNLINYGEPFAPKYNVKNTKVPVYLTASIVDGLVPAKDVKALADDLPNVKGFHLVKELTFGHFHVAVGENAKELVYDKMVEFFKTL